MTRYALRTCEVCSQPYRPSYGKQRTCGLKCSVKLPSWQEGAGRGRPRLTWPTCAVTYRACRTCDSLFVSRANAVYCKPTCRPQYRAEGSLPLGAEVVIACACGQRFPAVVANGGRPKVCPDCKAAKASDEKRQERRKRRAAYGTDRIRKRARRYGVSYQPIRIADIAERDAWTCGICQLPVDKTRRYPDLASPSIDHILPMSLGGPHAPHNVRLTHWLCNSLRGAPAQPEPGLRPMGRG